MRAVVYARVNSCFALQLLTFFALRLFHMGSVIETLGDHGGATCATPWVRRYDPADETALDETSIPHPQSFPSTYSAPSASRQYVHGTLHFFRAPTSPPPPPPSLVSSRAKY